MSARKSYGLGTQFPTAIDRLAWLIAYRREQIGRYPAQADFDLRRFMDEADALVREVLGTRTPADDEMPVGELAA